MLSAPWQWPNLAGTPTPPPHNGFFNLTDNSFLDALDANDFFVVFGHVVSGTNVLNILSNFQYYTGFQSGNLVVNESSCFGSVFQDLPLLHPSLNSTQFFADISLLQVAIQPVAGGSGQISWNSAAGLTNILKHTTIFPPMWTILVTTNGTGARLSVTDNADAPRRFYRVRVPY
jgi:hypothetical protein